MIEWCFTPLSTVIQSYHGDSLHYSCLSSVSPVLGCGSEVDTPKKNPEDLVQLEPRTPGLQVKHFTTEPRRTPFYYKIPLAINCIKVETIANKDLTAHSVKCGLDLPCPQKQHDFNSLAPIPPIWVFQLSSKFVKKGCQKYGKMGIQLPD